MQVIVDSVENTNKPNANFKKLFLEHLTKAAYNPTNGSMFLWSMVLSECSVFMASLWYRKERIFPITWTFKRPLKRVGVVKYSNYRGIQYHNKEKYTLFRVTKRVVNALTKYNPLVPRIHLKCHSCLNKPAVFSCRSV